jgi:hypothetical protein
MWLLLLLACGNGKEEPAVPVVNDPRRVPDVNGDGLADVIAPVRDPDGGGGERAHVAVWLGPAEGGAPLLVPADATDLLPLYATFVGDVDGDGFSDLVWHESGAGAVSEPLLMPGSADGPVPDGGVRFADPGTDSDGALVRWVGDVDGDRLDDVVVLRSWTMAVHLAAGGIGGQPESVWTEGSPSFTSMGDAWRGERVGEVLALGDVTGDGLADVLAWWYALRDDDSTFVETWAYVIPGPLDGSEWIPMDQVFPGVYGNHNVGVASLGDFDDDGLVDLYVGDPNGARLWSSHGWERQDGLMEEPPHASLATGDLNADGICDLAGPTDIDLGRGDGLPLDAEPDFSFPLPTSETDASITPENLEVWRYGIWGGGVGDVDGDGFDDLAIGSDANLWLWHGGPGGGREDDSGTQLVTNYLQPLGTATRGGAH